MLAQAEEGELCGCFITMQQKFKHSFQFLRSRKQCLPLYLAIKSKSLIRLLAQLFQIEFLVSDNMQLNSITLHPVELSIKPRGRLSNLTLLDHLQNADNSYCLVQFQRTHVVTVEFQVHLKVRLLFEHPWADVGNCHAAQISAIFKFSVLRHGEVARELGEVLEYESLTIFLEHWMEELVIVLVLHHAVPLDKLVVTTFEVHLSQVGHFWDDLAIFETKLFDFGLDIVCLEEVNGSVEQLIKVGGCTHWRV